MLQAGFLAGSIWRLGVINFTELGGFVPRILLDQMVFLASTQQCTLFPNASLFMIPQRVLLKERVKGGIHCSVYRKGTKVNW